MRSPRPDSDTHSQAGSYLPEPVTSRHDYCMSAAMKRYKYLRRLFKFQQMDFQFAFWQMWYLFVSPQKVYRNFHYRKRKYMICYIFLLKEDRCVSTLKTIFIVHRNQKAIC